MTFSATLLSVLCLLCFTWVLQVEAFSLLPSQKRVVALLPRAASSCRRRTTQLHYSVSDEDEDDEDDDDEEDDDEYIDSAALGDWRTFRRNLATSAVSDNNDESTSKKSRKKSVSKGNEELLLSQNEKLAKEYMTGVWAHETSTPEVGGLLVRMPLEVELFRNHKHSMAGRQLKTLLTDDDGNSDIDLGIWYARAKRLVEEEMKTIAGMADDEGQIDATTLKDTSAEMLTLFLDNQETWQEVCLALQHSTKGTAKTLVLNRPMAFKLTENLGRLVLNGAFTKKDLLDNNNYVGGKKDLMRFMMAFSSECAVYVGGPDDQGEEAIMIHGIEDLEGAVEISPGAKIYWGGVNAAMEGVLAGKYSPLEFRFFVGCHNYDDSALDVAVHLGKYQPVACARALALKQCISLPKPLWHEVMELCGGDMEDISSLELMKRDDLQFQVLDETDYDDEDEIPDELGELENFDDEDEEFYL